MNRLLRLHFPPSLGGEVTRGRAEASSSLLSSPADATHLSAHRRPGCGVFASESTGASHFKLPVFVPFALFAQHDRGGNRLAEEEVMEAVGARSYLRPSGFISKRSLNFVSVPLGGV